KVTVHQKSCPLFVPLAEEGVEWWEDEITIMVAKRYFSFFDNTGIDTLILGCTHYPLLKNSIRQTIGNDVCLVDSAYITAKQTKIMLEKSGLLKKSSSKGILEIYTSDSIERFMPMCNAILGMDCLNINKCDVGE
ncbi:MAG: glutamate racemase, partial [Clostridiaceae bacterium]|nr:glutamate racemase [Clostridiaceae bacterium]